MKINNLTYSQMIQRRRNIMHELSCPSLSPEERKEMENEYRALTVLTSNRRSAI